MGDKPTVRPGLTSPDQSQDVEFAIDKQIDEGQHERDEKEGRGPLGPPKMDKRYKSNREQPEVDKQSETPETEKHPRGTFP
ncbi:MAG TPA: hypothetical protein VLA64_07430 [Azonexus sp.]|nr:hypothetical protein [Azonexus sp.]